MLGRKLRNRKAKKPTKSAKLDLETPRRAPLPRFGRESLKRLGRATLVAMLLSALMVQWRPKAGAAGLEVGDIASTDVRARRTFEVRDDRLTKEKRQQARDGTPPVFQLDALQLSSTRQRLDEAFSAMRGYLEQFEARADEPEPTPPEGDDEAPISAEADATARPDPVELFQRVEAFQATLGVELRDIDQDTLVSVGFGSTVQRDIGELLRVAMTDPVILDRAALQGDAPITVHRVEGSRTEEHQVSDLSLVRDLHQARDLISQTAAADFSDRPPHVLETVIFIARALVAPTLVFNASETLVRKELAAAQVKPVTTTWKRGQIIVRSGEPAQPWSIAALEKMNEDTQSYNVALHLGALTLLFVLVLSLVTNFAHRYVPRFRNAPRDVWAMGGLLVFTGGLASLAHTLGTLAGDTASAVPPEAYAFLVPVAAGAIVVRALMTAETAIVWSVLTSLVAATLVGGDLFVAGFYLASSLAAAGGIGHATERGRLLRAGFVASLVNVALVASMGLVALAGLDGYSQATRPVTDLVFPLLFALAGGITSGVVAVGLIPLFEQVGFLTDSKLLELSNLNHPLLREMIVRAPGSYHHSMMVGQLGEAAAKAIGADSLLVRVGANFHDIGKMLKPLYFIENQRGAENPHDRLSPSMSALVIIAHVKEGIELAREHALPEPIIDMIPQHHGTSLVSFFYNRALEQQDANKGEVDDSAYRYPGPNPQTREAAIMMLADIAEASTRSLKVHTEGAIRARVQGMVNKVLSLGLLDECPITLKDLAVVSETFVQVLQGIYHHRVEYPAAAQKSDQDPKVRHNTGQAAISLDRTPDLDTSGSITQSLSGTDRSNGSRGAEGGA